jgi:hypothetical protein
MAKKSKGKAKRTMGQIANAMYKTPPASSDPARAVQEMHRARGSGSPLGGMALINPLLAGVGAIAAKARRK